MSPKADREHCARACIGNDEDHFDCRQLPESLRQQVQASLFDTLLASPKPEVFHVFLIRCQIGNAAVKFARTNQLSARRSSMLFRHQAYTLANHPGWTPSAIPNQPIQRRLRFLIQSRLYTHFHTINCITTANFVIHLTSLLSIGLPSRSPSSTTTESPAVSVPSGLRLGSRASCWARRGAAGW